MGKVKVIRKGDGSVYKDKKGRIVFVKDGVHFALDESQQNQVIDLIQGLRTGALLTIDPNSEDMARGD